jgi:hypothetical protein
MHLASSGYIFRYIRQIDTPTWCLYYFSSLALRRPGVSPSGPLWLAAGGDSTLTRFIRFPRSGVGHLRQVSRPSTSDVASIRSIDVLAAPLLPSSGWWTSCGSIVTLLGSADLPSPWLCRHLLQVGRPPCGSVIALLGLADLPSPRLCRHTFSRTACLSYYSRSPDPEASMRSACLCGSARHLAPVCGCLDAFTPYFRTSFMLIGLLDGSSPHLVDLPEVRFW